MTTVKELQEIVGCSADAYDRRDDGYSPDYIRNAVWELVEDDVQGCVLDVGSGSGGWIKCLKQSDLLTQLLSVDIVDDGASQIPGVEFHLADLSIEPLPCEKAQIDWIFSLEVVEHLANPRNFIHQASRVLRDDGKLVISTPNVDSLRSKLSFLFRGYFSAFCEHDYRITGHITPVSSIDLERMADEAGFRQVEFFYPPVGLVPMSRLQWQKVLPWLTGKNWSDTMIAIIKK